MRYFIQSLIDLQKAKTISLLLQTRGIAPIARVEDYIEKHDTKLEERKNGKSNSKY